MSTTYTFALMFLFLLVSAANIALGYFTAILFREGAISVAGLHVGALKLDPAWLRLPNFRRSAAPNTLAPPPAAASPAAEAAPPEPATGPAKFEGTSLASFKLSEVMATFSQSVYEQDLLLRDFLENPGDAERARQLADGLPKTFERHLKRFNQTAAKLDSLGQTDAAWLTGRQRVKDSLEKFIAEVKSLRDGFVGEDPAAMVDSLTSIMRGGVEKALQMRDELERGLEAMLRVEPGLTRLPTEIHEEKGKHLLGRAWLAERQVANFERSGKFAAALFDIHGLKALNQEHGFAVGALLIDGVDKLLTDNLKSGEWIFRIEGGRWCMLLSSTDPETVIGRVDRLRQQVAAVQFEWAKKQITLTLCGAAVISQPGNSLEQLETQLRIGLHAAKAENSPLMLVEGAESKAGKTVDLALAPLTIPL